MKPFYPFIALLKILDMLKNLSGQKLLITLAITLLLMYFGRILFIPLFFALLVSFIIYPVCRWMESKGISRPAAIGIGIFIALIPLAAIVLILIVQLTHISQQWPAISGKLLQLLDNTTIPFYTDGMDLAQKEAWLKSLITSNPSRFYSSMLSSVSGLVQALIIPFYVALILYHRHRLIEFLQYFFPSSEAGRLRNILRDTVTAYHSFVKGMILVYLVVGTLNSIGLALLGIPNAIVYGFTASILTFIPYVGIIIGSVLPVIVAWTMHDSIYYPLAVVGIFALVQFLEANFIFPLAVSHRIKVNTLVTIIAIFLGGIIWGAAGMILFIPFLAILKLISDKVEALKPLAILLGTHKASGQKASLGAEEAEKAETCAADIK